MLLGFKERFAEPIKAGTKKMTIRKKRKHEPKIGERLYMYSHLRTKNCKKITDKLTLKGIQLVDIGIKQMPLVTEVRIMVDGRKLWPESIDEFIKADGFSDLNDFADYWCAGVKANDKGVKMLLESGLVIHHWTDLRF